MVARRAHNPKVTGSSPVPATSREVFRLSFFMPQFFKKTKTHNFLIIFNNQRICKEHPNELRFVKRMKFVRTIFILLVTILICLCIINILADTPHINDSLEYKNSANNLLNKKGIYAGDLNQEKDYRLYTKRTIGYPVFIILNHNVNIITFIVQGLLVVLCFFLGLGIVRNYSNNKHSLHLFCVGYILHLALLFHASFVLSDLLLTAVITLAALVYLQKKESFKNKLFVLCILWSVSVLIKPVMLPSLFLIPLFIIYTAFKKRRFYWPFLLPILFVTLHILYNHSIVNQYEYSSISTINLAQYNAKLTISSKYGYDSAQRFVQNDVLSTPRTLGQYRSYTTNAKSLGAQAILDNFGAYVKVHSLGASKMLLDPGRFELYTFFGEETNTLSLTEMLFSGDYGSISFHLKKNPVLLLVYVFLIILAILKAFGVVVEIKHWKKHIFGFAIILYFLAVTGPVGAARFFLPVSIIYIAIASEGLLSVLNFFQKRSKS